jgi:hypothetical protein
MDESTHSRQSKPPDPHGDLLGCIGLIALLLVIAYLAHRLLGIPPRVLWIAVGVLFLLNALLLWTRVIKPGGRFLIGQTPLGTFLIGTGFLGELFALDSPSSLAQVVFLLMTLCLPVGVVIEGRAWKPRRDRDREGSRR